MKSIDVSAHKSLHSIDADTPNEIHEVYCVNLYRLHSIKP